MDKKSQIQFHYVKSNTFKTSHADGIFGGITPRGEININFFAERFPIPQITTHEVLDELNVGKEIARESKDGIIRELECGITINVDNAKIISAWLSQKIQEIESLNK